MTDKFEMISDEELSLVTGGSAIEDIIKYSVENNEVIIPVVKIQF